MTKEEALKITTLKGQLISERDKLQEECEVKLSACCKDSFASLFIGDQVMRNLNLRDYNAMIFTISIVESLLNDEEETDE